MRIERDDVAFMKDQDKWPLWPRLPIKRSSDKGGWPEMGILVGGAGSVVYLINMFEKAVTDAGTIEYDSYEDLYNAGWRVD